MTFFKVFCLTVLAIGYLLPQSNARDVGCVGEAIASNSKIDIVPDMNGGAEITIRTSFDSGLMVGDRLRFVILKSPLVRLRKDVLPSGLPCEPTVNETDATIEITCKIASGPTEQNKLEFLLRVANAKKTPLDTSDLGPVATCIERGSTEPGSDAPIPNDLPPSDRVKDINVYESCGVNNSIALTFSGGPVPNRTELILDNLKKHGLKATFFLSPGRSGSSLCRVVKRMVAEGHGVQASSWNGTDYSRLSMDDIERDLNRTRDWIYNCIGKRPTQFQPLLGTLRRDQAEFISKLGYVISLWNLDSNDLSAEDLGAVLENIDVALQDYKDAFHSKIEGIVLEFHDRAINASKPSDLDVSMFFDALVSRFEDLDFVRADACYNACKNAGRCLDRFLHHPQLEDWEV
jgi:peptidoglycan/xylan/chitin deacetylase (PgdA/CDA1 family)